MKNKIQLSGDACMVLCFCFGVFAYAWVVSFLLQVVVIPRNFSGLDAARGLVVFDSIGFDGIASIKAKEILRNGWSAWELRPGDGNMPAGIASIFYVIWKPVPYSVLPFNSLIHAIAAGVVLLILRSFFQKLPAVLGAAVFALNPAAMEWVSQIHREGVFICGNLMFIFGMIRLSVENNSKNDPSDKFTIVLPLALAIFGVGVVWIARIYWIPVMAISSIMVLAISVINVKPVWAKQANAYSVLRIIGIVSIITLQILVIRNCAPSGLLDMSSIPFSKAQESEEKNSAHSMFWSKTSWLPNFVDGRLYRMALWRRGAILHGGGSIVDSDRLLWSSVEIFSYIPRALQVGVLSPFPSLWSGQASTPALTIGRKIVGITTCIFYICLVGSILGIAKMRARPEVWAMTGLCLIGILVYAIGYPNVGTLIRYRYGFYMLVVAFGTAHWSSILFRLRDEARSSP